MWHALAAGIAYFTVVFAVGFMLGTLRVLAVAPLLGEHRAVLVELPVMLAVSWLACRRITRRLGVPNAIGPRLATGALALALMLAAELGVAVLAFDRTVAGHVAAYRHGPAAYGLAAQTLFGLFPLLQGLLDKVRTTGKGAAEASPGGHR